MSPPRWRDVGCGAVVAVLFGMMALSVGGSIRQRMRERRVERTIARLYAWATALDLERRDRMRRLAAAEGRMTSDELATLLVPTYASDLPQRDGWGRSLRVVLSGAHYEVRSLGEDGMPDSESPFPAAPNGETRDFQADIVMRDGSVVQWPYIQCRK